MAKCAKAFGLLCLVLLLLVFTLTAAHDGLVSSAADASVKTTGNSWTTKAPMHEARSNLGVAVVKGKIYAIGGNAEQGNTGLNEEYDPVTDTWTFKAAMLTPRSYFTVAVYQNKIYCIGGTTGYSNTGEPYYTGVVEVYDPDTDSWENKTPMPTAKVAKANVVNGKIYLIGGAPNNTLNQVYDPATDSWTTKSSMPTEAYGASAVIDNKIYFISGSYGGQYPILNQICDPETDTWSQGAPPPSADYRIEAAVATTGEMAPKRVYALDKTLRIYDPETNNWTLGADVPTDRDGFAVAVVNDILYAIGGYNILPPSDPYTTPPGGGQVIRYNINEQYTPFGYGTVPPTIDVVSPENRTYGASDVALTFIVNKPVSSMSYSLDGATNATATENVTLTGLTNGLHNVTVYAADSFGNVGASETLFFTIAEETGLLSPAAVAASASAAVVICLGLAVYLAKTRRRNQKPTNQPPASPE